MANLLYVKAKEALLKGGIDVLGDTVKVTLVDLGAYTFDPGHELLSDIPAGARVASAELQSKSVAGGTFDAADVTFGSVTGPSAEALVLWQDTGDENTSKLIAYYDEGVAGLPVTPSGGDILLAWSPQGIFAL